MRKKVKNEQRTEVVIVKGVIISDKIKTPSGALMVAKKQLQAWAISKKFEYGIIATSLVIDNPKFDSRTFRGMWRSTKTKEELESKGVKVL